MKKLCFAKNLTKNFKKHNIINMEENIKKLAYEVSGPVIFNYVKCFPFF